MEIKLDEIIDKLLVKTQDGYCQWERTNKGEFILQLFSAKIYLYYFRIREGANSVVLNVVSNNNPEIVLANINKDDNDINSNLYRLFDAAKKYHEVYVNTCIDKLRDDIMKLGVPEDPRAYL